MGKAYNKHSQRNSLYDHIARKKNLTKASKLDVEISTSPPIDKKVLMYFSFFVISFNDFFYQKRHWPNYNLSMHANQAMCWKLTTYH